MENQPGRCQGSALQPRVSFAADRDTGGRAEQAEQNSRTLRLYRVKRLVMLVK